MASFSKIKTAVGSNYRETIFMTWVAYILWNKFIKPRFSSRRSGSLSGTSTGLDVGSVDDTTTEIDASGTVKVRGSSMRFTKVKSDTTKLQLNWMDALEYWLPVVIRGADAWQIYSLGPKAFFAENSPMEKIPVILFAAFCLLPTLEFVLPEDWANPNVDDKKHSRKELKYRLPLYLWTALELFTTVSYIKQLVNTKDQLTLKNKFLLALGLGFFNGAIGITVSHELLHKPNRFEKILGYMLLCNVNYMHWGEEHLTGHHTHVATDNDPATAKLNQTLYEFLPQTIIGSFLSANRLESERLGKLGISYFDPRNRMLWNIVIPMVWAGVIAKITKGGWTSVGVFYMQGIVAASMLEVINYIEHYGLRRDKLDNGGYEPVNPTHSWNSPHCLTNALLLKLQRHSDHHTFAMRPYHLLRNFEESPQLPTGYPGMYTLAFFPPAFFWVMNPLVAAFDANNRRLKTEAAKLSVNGEEGYVFSKSQELVAAENEAKLKLKAPFGIPITLGVGLSMYKRTSAMR